MLLALFLLPFLASAQDQGADLDAALGIRSFVLSNGLTVYIHPDHSVPRVFGMVVVKAGGKDDPADATGMAHYMEHMLFKGTSELGTINYTLEKPLIDSIFLMYDSLGATENPEARAAIQSEINRLSLEASQYAIPNEFSNIVKGMGGTGLNAGTGPDQTVFYNTFPPHQLEKWLDLYSHRFIDPVFRSFQAELEVVYEEKNLYSDMFFMGLLEEYQKHFFKNHPYGQQTLIGTADDLKNPSLNKMYKFFKEWYVPGNMALILSGDIDPDVAQVMIEEKFGVMSSEADIPQHQVYNEEPFKGREYHEGKLSPVRILLLGFRTVPAGHPDELPLQVANQLLNNSNETGLLDQLSIDNELMAAMAIPLPYQDHGATVFIGIPKLVGQSMRSAEALMLAQIAKVAHGDFNDTLLQAIKLRMYREHQLSLESPESIAMMISQSFSSGIPLENFLSYADRVQSISKDDIVRVVRLYYGQDYMAFFSKIGFKQKDKIEKPGYEPIVANTDAKSPYAKSLAQIPSLEPNFRWVNFDTDLDRGNILKHNYYHVTGKKNDIFTFRIQYHVGSEVIPYLEESAGLMGFAGTQNRDVQELKTAFEQIGCTYSIWADESFMTIEISGIDRYFKESISLLNELMKEPALDEKRLKVLINGARAERVMERTQPDMVAEALYSYAKYKDRSPNLTRTPMKKLKKLGTDDVLNAFNEALRYRCSYHYSGTLDKEMVSETISSVLEPTTHPLDNPVPFVRPLEDYTENTVYLVPMKKARQSKIYLYTKGPIFIPEESGFINAFNLYFGGDFSGLVLQEIREYRSLAYSAGAGFSSPPLIGKMTYFTGYVGTQSDKTFDALAVFDTLIREMPAKPERLEFLRPYLVEGLSTARPGERYLSTTVERWERLGYAEDPGINKLTTYQGLEWQNIEDFWSTNLRDRPITICIVGDTRQFDTEKLQQYGTVVSLKQKDLFSK